MKKKLSLCLLLILICVLCMSSTAAFAAVEATDETGSQVALDQSEVTFSSTQKQVVHVTYTGYDTISYDIVEGQNLIDAEWSDCWGGDSIQLFITRITDNEGTAKIKIYPTDKKNDYKVITVKLNVPSDEPSDSEKRVNWQFVASSGTLMIYGEGAMGDYTFGDNYKAYVYKNATCYPWQNHANDVKKVKICDGITHVGDWAFARMKNIEKIEIANTVKDIGEGAFAYCTKIKEVSLPDSVKEVKCQAFRGCGRLEELNLNKVEKIGEEAFNNCASLTGVVIPSSVKEMHASSPFKTSNIKFKSMTPPKFVEYSKYTTWFDYGGKINVYIPKDANKELFLKEFHNAYDEYDSYWKQKHEWNIIEYDDTAAKALAKDVKLKVSSAKLVKGTKITAKASSGDLKAIKNLGYNVTYKYYRSTKKTSGYVLMKESKYSTYKNTSGKKGTKYYYKALIEITDACGDVIYTGSAKDQTPCYRTFK